MLILIFRNFCKTAFLSSGWSLSCRIFRIYLQWQYSGGLVRNTPTNINVVRTHFTTCDRYQKTEISQLFCAETRWRRHVLNGFLRRSRPSISMTTDASLNARRLGAIDRPLASPYSTSEIPDLSVTTTIYRRLLNVDPEVPALRWVAALLSRQ